MTNERFANTAKEFPDFDLSTLPAIPAGFVDISWHNDTCPSFLNEELGLIVFVDYADADKREHPETVRFNVNVWDNGNTGIEVMCSDDWAKILPALLPVTDEPTAKAFLGALYAVGLAYHPDDSADDCLSSHGLNVEYLEIIQNNVNATFDHVDPSAVLLDLMGE